MSGFFIYMIEAPSAEDLYENRLEADMIRQAAKFSGIPFADRQVQSFGHLHRAVQEDLPQLLQQHQGRIPILHIAGHGNKEGIALGIDRNGNHAELISWNTLKYLLSILNRMVSGNLIVCISSCEGLNGLRMAFDHTVGLPFAGLLGNSGKPTLAETAVAFATIYHHLSQDAYIHDAVEAMKKASKNQYLRQKRGKKGSH